MKTFDHLPPAANSPRNPFLDDAAAIDAMDVNPRAVDGFVDPDLALVNKVKLELARRRDRLNRGVER